MNPTRISIQTDRQTDKEKKRQRDTQRTNTDKDLGEGDLYTLLVEI